MGNSTNTFSLLNKFCSDSTIVRQKKTYIYFACHTGTGTFWNEDEPSLVVNGRAQRSSLHHRRQREREILRNGTIGN